MRVQGKRDYWDEYLVTTEHEKLTFNLYQGMSKSETNSSGWLEPTPSKVRSQSDCCRLYEPKEVYTSLWKVALRMIFCASNCPRAL
jgi:hypothetical protein